MKYFIYESCYIDNKHVARVIIETHTPYRVHT